VVGEIISTNVTPMDDMVMNVGAIFAVILTVFVAVLLFAA
jgi:hypothetical protein